jgi:hypothetical protein
MRKTTMIAIMPLFLLAVAVALTRYVWAVFTAPTRALALALAFDRLGNAATNGADTETISSRADKARQNGRMWGCILCKFLDGIDANHCQNSRGI